MATEDELEALLRSRRTTQDAQARSQEEQRATQAAEAARHAAGFIALMKRHGVQPEPIYTSRQVKNRRGKVTAEMFTRVYSGWVVQYALTEYDEPWLILCLDDRGIMFSCDARGLTQESFPYQGLLPNPKSAFRTLRTGGRLLVAPLESGRPAIKPRPPYLKLEAYAKAAEWYLA